MYTSSYDCCARLAQANVERVRRLTRKQAEMQSDLLERWIAASQGKATD